MDGKGQVLLDNHHNQLQQIVPNENGSTSVLPIKDCFGTGLGSGNISTNSCGVREDGFSFYCGKSASNIVQRLIVPPLPSVSFSNLEESKLFRTIKKDIEDEDRENELSKEKGKIKKNGKGVSGNVGTVVSPKKNRFSWSFAKSSGRVVPGGEEGEGLKEGLKEGEEERPTSSSMISRFRIYRKKRREKSKTENLQLNKNDVNKKEMEMEKKKKVEELGEDLTTEEMKEMKEMEKPLLTEAVNDIASASTSSVVQDDSTMKKNTINKERKNEKKEKRVVNGGGGDSLSLKMKKNESRTSSETATVARLKLKVEKQKKSKKNGKCIVM